MLNSLLSGISDYVQNAVANNAEVPSHQKSSVADSILGVLKNSATQQMGSGNINLGQIGNLLGGGSNSFASANHSAVVDAIAAKTGINPTVAHSIGSAVVPGLESAVKSKLGI